MKKNGRKRERLQAEPVNTSEEMNDFISFLRSRLDVISTSVYLLETCWEEKRKDPAKYFKRINDEMELIRKYINI